MSQISEKGDIQSLNPLQKTTQIQNLKINPQEQNFISQTQTNQNNHNIFSLNRQSQYVKSQPQIKRELLKLNQQDMKINVPRKLLSSSKNRTQITKFLPLNVQYKQKQTNFHNVYRDTLQSNIPLLTDQAIHKTVFNVMPHKRERRKKGNKEAQSNEQIQLNKSYGDLNKFSRPFSQRVSSRERPWKLNSKLKPDYLDFYEETQNYSKEENGIIGNCLENVKENERKDIVQWEKGTQNVQQNHIEKNLVDDTQKYQFIRSLLNENKKNNTKQSKKHLYYLNYSNTSIRKNMVQEEYSLHKFNKIQEQLQTSDTQYMYQQYRNIKTEQDEQRCDRAMTSMNKEIYNTDLQRKILKITQEAQSPLLQPKQFVIEKKITRKSKNQQKENHIQKPSFFD